MTTNGKITSKKRGTGFASKRVKRVAVAKVKTAALTKLIRQVHIKDTEPKNVVYTSSIALSSSIGTSWPTTCIVPLSPYSGYVNPTQGVGQGQRVGNKVRTKRCILSGVITSSGYNAVSNAFPTPQDVVIWIFTTKQSNSITTSLSSANFFQNGSTTSNLQGNLVDLILPINQDSFILRGRKVFKQGYASYVGSGNIPNSGNFNNNDYKLSNIFKWDITDMLPTVIDWNDGSAFPNSYLVQMAVESVDSQGTGQSPNALPTSMTFSINYVYTDM